MGKLFTSESVTEGHPDKIADQISDAILDALIEQDPDSRVAAETTVATGLALVVGEITTKAYVDIAKVVRNTIRDIGYTGNVKGKKIGVTIGSAIHSYVIKELERNGLKKEDVELINIPFTESMTTLQKGDIDVAASFEPHIASGVNKGIEVNNLGNGVGTGTAYSVIVASDEFVEKNPEVAAKILDLLQRASDWLYANEDEAIEIIKKKYGQDEASIKTTIDTFEYGISLDDEFKKGLEDTQKFMVDNELILNEVDLDTFIDDSVYKLTETAKGAE